MEIQSLASLAEHETQDCAMSAAAQAILRLMGITPNGVHSIAIEALRSTGTTPVLVVKKELSASDQVAIIELLGDLRKTNGFGWSTQESQ